MRLLRSALLATALLPAFAPQVLAGTLPCSLVPGKTLALVRVETDTTLSFAPSGAAAMMSSSVRPGTYDSLLATPSTPMPAGRVRILQLDSATRAALAANGITDAQPTALVRAAPYRADCRTVRWTDSTPFVQRGEVGYMRGHLAAREHWIGGVPVIVIPEAWDYPYPRRRGLAYGLPGSVPLASAEAMFSINSALEMPDPTSVAMRIAADRVKRARAIEWARANESAAELEPVRTTLRRTILESDWEVAESIPSRLRGTYRVDIETGGEQGTWFFRTYDRPGYVWNGGNGGQSTRALLASPHVAGYQLVGFAARARDSLVSVSPMQMPRPPLVWLSATDRPTAPGNDSRTALPSVLEFTLAAAPEALWNALETRVRPTSAAEAAGLARMNITIKREERQPQLPMTIRLDSRGGVRADTTLQVGGRSIRVVLERVDTISVKRPF